MGHLGEGDEEIGEFGGLGRVKQAVSNDLFSNIQPSGTRDGTSLPTFF